jgi:hypothetical protein
MPSTTAGPITGNTKRKVYHLPACLDYDKVSLQPRVPFPTEAAARQAEDRKAQHGP